MAARPGFICDRMLGSLARWLRFFGFDTLYPGPENDADLMRLAEREGRILLTRDKELAARAGTCGLLIRMAVLDEQLAQVRDDLGLDISGQTLLSRCSLCNTELSEISREEAARRGAPDGVVRRYPVFWRCPGCGQLYWPGSHYDRIMGKLTSAFPAARRPGR